MNDEATLSGMLRTYHDNFTPGSMWEVVDRIHVIGADTSYSSFLEPGDICIVEVLGDTFSFVHLIDMQGRRLATSSRWFADCTRPI